MGGEGDVLIHIDFYASFTDSLGLCIGHLLDMPVPNTQSTPIPL